MRLGAPDESGRRPEPVPGSEFVDPVDTVVKAIGQRPRDEFRALLESVDEDGGPRTRRSSPPATPSTAAPASSRPCATRSAPRRDRRGAPMDELTEIRWHARAGQGAKTAAQILALALLRTARACRRFPSTARSAAARRCARSRASRPPIRRPRLGHRAGRRRRARAVARPRGRRHRRARVGRRRRPERRGAAAELDGFDVRCVPPAASRRRWTRGFVNIVMLGAVAAALGEPPLEQLQDAAVETLGRKVDAEDVRRALAEGYAWLS